MGKVNHCNACHKRLSNGDSVVFRELDGLPFIACKKDDRIIEKFLKNITTKEAFENLDENAHFFKYPHTTYLLTQIQYESLEAFIVELMES